MWTGPSTAIEGGFSPKLRAVGVPEQLETGTTLIIDPARASNGDIMDGVIGAKFTSGVEVDPSITTGAVDNIEGDAVGSDIGAEGDAGGTWWGSGAGDAISWAVLLKWLSVGVAATALLVKTYPWWGQKVKYMVQKCKDGRSLAVMEFSTDDWGGERGGNYRFRYDFKCGRWVLEYTSMSLLRAKTFPSPQEVEQFIGTSTCKKFVDRCTEVLYRVLDDEAFEGFVEFLQSKDKASYKLCKQLIDNKESLHRTFETMKVKYL